LKLKGKTPLPDDRGIGAFIPTGNLQHKLHIWLARPDNTFDFLMLDLSTANVAALDAVSKWTERSQGSGGRNYGQLDLAALAASAPAAQTRSSNDDAEWMIWRYAILPQLIDTLTQLGFIDLLDPTTRGEVLNHLGKDALVDRLARVDEFLAHELSLYLSIEGQGLGRGIVVSEVPLRIPPAPGMQDEPEAAADLTQGEDELGESDEAS
jgi:hypothetical protein